MLGHHRDGMGGSGLVSPQMIKPLESHYEICRVRTHLIIAEQVKLFGVDF